jgi:membrane associated rhomboid family serine protease
VLFRNPEDVGVSKEALGRGEFWRLFTFLFAHPEATHFAMSMLALLGVGLLARELGLTSTTVAAAYLLVGYTVGIIVVLLSPAGEPYVFVGNSIGILGILGFESVKAKELGIPPFIPVLVFIFAVLVMPALRLLQGLTPFAGGEGIRDLAHLFALLLGVILGIGVKPKRKRRQR